MSALLLSTSTHAVFRLPEQSDTKRPVAYTTLRGERASSNPDAQVARTDPGNAAIVRAMRNVLPWLCAALAACSSSAPTDAAPHAPAMPEPSRTPASHDDRMAWWRDARFGMFVHWGLYAIPAGAWDGKSDYGEWIRDSARIPLSTYDRFQSQWNPTAFDADAWARMAKDAGMKYLVLTSKHHDGFCLFDSKETDWDVMNTQHGRDICKELADACARYGVIFCLYHSIMDWHHPDYLPRRPWEAADRGTKGADFLRYESYLHAQVREVITQYHPAVMWFDGEWESTWNHERGTKLFELCRSLAPGMLVNNRVDVHRGGMAGFSNNSEAKGDFATPEQEIPATGAPGVDWESCMTMNRHWGFNAADTQWKSSKELLRNLIDIASKGGNYLLNVGPRADGSFPEEATERLAAIGRWMRDYGESIHGTTANVLDATPWGRCTVREGDDTSTLYLHVFEPRLGQLDLRLLGLMNRIRSVRVLGGKGEPAQTGLLSPFQEIEQHVAVRLSEIDDIANVIAVEIEGRPDIARAPRIDAETEEFVTSVDASVVPTSRRAVTTFTLDGSEPRKDGPLANGPIRIDTSCTLKAASFFDGKQAYLTTERTFRKVDPIPAVEPVAPEEGLWMSTAPFSGSSLAKADADGKAGTRGIATRIGVGQQHLERVRVRFSGFLRVPADDLYRFSLTSDDGSILRIAGQLVVDNDGLHGAIEKQGAIALQAGLHPIEVSWFNGTGGAELDLRWARPGQTFASIDATSLCH
jgi:alpha-L-fucosidase